MWFLEISLRTKSITSCAQGHYCAWKWCNFLCSILIEVTCAIGNMWFSFLSKSWHFGIPFSFWILHSSESFLLGARMLRKMLSILRNSNIFIVLCTAFSSEAILHYWLFTSTLLGDSLESHCVTTWLPTIHICPSFWRLIRCSVFTAFL